MEKECLKKIKGYLLLLESIPGLSSVGQNKSLRVVENKLCQENMYSNSSCCVWNSDLFGTGFSGATEKEARENEGIPKYGVKG